MYDKIILLLYLCIAILMISIHHIAWFAAIAVLLLLLAYSKAWKITKKTLLALALFNGIVTLSYIGMIWIKGWGYWEFIALFNLRVFDMTFMTLLVFEHINIIRALSFCKTLAFLLAASLSQIETFRRTYEEFGLTLKSRTIKPLRERNKREFLETMFFYFFKKAHHNSDELSLSLKARGFFDRM